MTDFDSGPRHTLTTREEDLINSIIADKVKLPNMVSRDSEKPSTQGILAKYAQNFNSGELLRSPSTPYRQKTTDEPTLSV